MRRLILRSVANLRWGGGRSHLKQGADTPQIQFAVGDLGAVAIEVEFVAIERRGEKMPLPRGERGWAGETVVVAKPEQSRDHRRAQGIAKTLLLGRQSLRLSSGPSTLRQASPSRRETRKSPRAGRSRSSREVSLSPSPSRRKTALNGP